MMFPAHLLGTLLLGLLISRIRPFEPRDWLLAIGFGVVIDLDHVLQFPRYVATNGFQIDPASMLAWNGWQGIMHQWWAAFIVLGACLVFTSWIPGAFWLLHMFQDFVVAGKFVKFGSPLEWAITAVLAAVVLALIAMEHRSIVQRPAFGRFAVARIGLAGILLRR